jgi:hypothetical protein
VVLRARRQARPTTGVRGTTTIGAAVELSAMHLLLVPSTIHPDEVCDLLRARVQGSELARTGQGLLGRHRSVSL